MKAVLPGVAVLSILLILLPTSLGWISTEQEFVSQRRLLGDDDERYLLPSVPPHAPEALILADALFLCCNDAGTLLPDDVLREWTAIANSRGWATTTTDYLPRTGFNQELSYSVALLDRSGQAVPLLLTESDNIFVAGYQPGTGNVLYRRRAFDSAWAGVVLRLERLTSEDSQP